MVTFLSIVHILTAIFLVLFVLIQDSKGDGMGATFGGGNSNSVLGATGAASLLVRMTRWTVLIFAATSILLTRMTSVDTGSVIDKAGTTPAEKSQPATGLQTAPGTPANGVAAGAAAVSPGAPATTTPPAAGTQK